VSNKFYIIDCSLEREWYQDPIKLKCSWLDDKGVRLFEGGKLETVRTIQVVRNKI
jgi:hypothetical protein